MIKRIHWSVLLLAMFIMVANFRYAECIGLQLGFGKFYPDDTTLISNGDWASNLNLRIPQGKIFIIDIGAIVYKTNEDELSLPPELLPDEVNQSTVKRRMLATGFYGAIGLGRFLGSSGIGIFPFASVGAGIMGISTIARWEYVTQVYVPYDEQNKELFGRPFFIGNIGAEATFMHIGMFVKFSYLLAQDIEYSGINVAGYGVSLPGGSINPSGLIFYIGLALN
ncbi:hypothetical protein JW877_00235 [bacterium]|nr:hypothetical protein [bacterium]